MRDLLRLVACGIEHPGVCQMLLVLRNVCDFSSGVAGIQRSEEHTSELQSRLHLVCRLLLEKKKKKHKIALVEKNKYAYIFHTIFLNCTINAYCSKPHMTSTVDARHTALDDEA